MRWFKVVAIAVGAMIAFLVVSAVIGLLIDVVIATLIVATVVLAFKVALYRRRLSRNSLRSEIREPTYGVPRPNRNTPDVDDELSRLKRKMAG